MVQVFKIWAGKASDPYIAIGTDVVDAMHTLITNKVIDNHYEVRKAELISTVGRLISKAAARKIAERARR